MTTVLRQFAAPFLCLAACQGGAASPVSDGGAADLARNLPPAPSPPAKVSPCDALGPPGTFQDITPPEVKASFGGQANYGTFAFALDPVSSGTVYLGTLSRKIWKSTDCGATWTHVDTGRNGAVLDSAMNWTFAIDPTDPNVLYTNAGYGNGGNGLYKSTNAGVDWDPIWPPADPALANAVQYGFVGDVAMDPADHLHLLVSFHAVCNPPFNQTCVAESEDGGASWRMVNGDAGWIGSEGQSIYFLGGRKRWLWSSASNGLFVTSDGGGSWQRAFGDDNDVSHAQGQLLHAPDGTFYLAAARGLWHSADGSAGSWTLVPNTGPISAGVASDGVDLFLSICAFPDFCTPAPKPYLTSTDGVRWVPYDSPTMNMGGVLQYDPGHHLLYSSNNKAGFWRVVTR